MPVFVPDVLAQTLSAIFTRICTATNSIAPIKANDTVASFIARTDAALYEAKHRGRGQFVVAEAMALKEAANGA